MNKVNTVIIPIAGMGTRFLPITKTISKEMLNILDKPLIDYAVAEAKEAGINNFIFVTNKNNIFPKNYFSQNKVLEIFLKNNKKEKLVKKINKLNIKSNNITIIEQKKPSGLGNAILKAEKLLKGKDFCVILPDDLILGKNCTSELIKVYNKNKNSVIGAMTVNKKEVKKYGIIDYFRGQGRALRVRGLVEKPDIENAPSNLAIVGRYILSNDIFQCLKKIKKGSGNEYQLTDAISLSNKTQETWCYKFSGKRYDCGSKLGYLNAQIAAGLIDKDIKKEVKNIIKNWEKSL
jgi:UTP--glucose-1-phosphate uridylyltransferase